MLKHLIAFTAIFCIASLGYSAAAKTGNVIKLAADGDSWSFASTDAGIVKIELTPSTTGTLYQLRSGSESGAIVWETTASETRRVVMSSTDELEVAAGGMPKIEDNVTIQCPVTLYLNTTDTAAAGFTGMYLYTGRKEGNN